MTQRILIVGAGFAGLWSALGAMRVFDCGSARDFRRGGRDRTAAGAASAPALARSGSARHDGAVGRTVRRVRHPIR